MLLPGLPRALTVQRRDEAVLTEAHIVGVGDGRAVVAEVAIESVRHAARLSGAIDADTV